MSADRKSKGLQVISNIEGAPYTMVINIPNVLATSNILKVKDEVRRGLSIKLSRTNAQGQVKDLGTSFGHYFHTKRQVELFGDAAYILVEAAKEIQMRRLNPSIVTPNLDLVKASDEISKPHRRKIKHDTEDDISLFAFSYSQRFENYLYAVSSQPARLKGFLDRVGTIAMNNLINDTLRHELKHFQQQTNEDKKRKRVNKIILTSGIVLLSVSGLATIFSGTGVFLVGGILGSMLISVIGDAFKNLSRLSNTQKEAQADAFMIANRNLPELATVRRRS